MSVTERTFNWRPQWDPRSNAYTFTPMCPTLSARTQVMRTKNQWLDQGREGACTGFGEEHVRALTPYPQPVTDAHAQVVYHEARRQDEWPGEDYEGSSVNGAMKAARFFGHIQSWLWATTLAEARHGLSYHGAGEVGSWWYADMFTPDSDGFLHPGGEKVGGHAYALAGYRWFPATDGLIRAYRMENSWGHDWGDNGGAWIWEDDLNSLLTNDGELAFPRKVR